MIGLISESVTQRDNEKPVYDYGGYQPPVNLLDLNLFRQGPPFTNFKEMREKAPVCWHSGNSTLEDSSGFWAITSHEGITTVSRDTDTYSSQRGGIHIVLTRGESPIPELTNASYNNMICMDGDLHSGLRDEHKPFFTPDAVKKLCINVESEIDRLLDEMAPLGKCNFVEKFSAELPLFTLSEILGIPAEDRHKLVRWMHYLEIASYVSTAGIDSVDVAIDEKFIQEFQENLAEMFEYGRFVLHGRRKSKQPDLLNAIAWAELEKSLLSNEYLDGSWLLIVFAGNDTTRNTLSGTMKLLSEHPKQKQMLIDNPDLIPNMVEESIRYISPVQHMRRTAMRDTELLGQKIAEGEKVVMWYNAANRDPAMFENPDVYDITRKNANRHVSFGFGKHLCIGNRVARMQLETAYRKILTRFPDIEASGEMKVAPNNFVYAISELPVKFSAS